MFVIRGRGRRWRVWYPDESSAPMPVPVYRDGVLVRTVQVGAPTGKMIESHFSGSYEECEAFIREAHPDAEIRRERVATRGEALAKARRTRGSDGG